MSIICAIFGHKLPVGAKVVPYLVEPSFLCRECGMYIGWEKMPRAVRNMRKEYLVRQGRGDIIAKSIHG